MEEIVDIRLDRLIDGMITDSFVYLKYFDWCIVTCTVSTGQWHVSLPIPLELVQLHPPFILYKFLDLVNDIQKNNML